MEIPGSLRKQKPLSLWKDNLSTLLAMKICLLSMAITLLSCQSPTGASTHSTVQEDIIMINKDSVQIEYYDFNSTQNGTRSLAYERGDGWLVEWWAMKDRKTGICVEYAPAADFYELQKSYYLNGVIKERGKFISKVAFGSQEYFDENGNCIRIVDEDKKFGAVKREDIIRLLEKEGWFNRKTGENIITKDSILSTDYKLYREMTHQLMSITFKRAVINKQGKEIEPPKWFIKINPRAKMYITRYIIDGNTGKFEKIENFEPKER